MTTFYWCRKTGQFVDKSTGKYITGTKFTGNIREWYETLVETIFDGSNRTNANHLLMHPAIFSVVSTSVLFKPDRTFKGFTDTPQGKLYQLPIAEPGIRAIPMNEIWLMKGVEPVGRVVVLELGIQ